MTAADGPAPGDGPDDLLPAGRPEADAASDPLEIDVTGTQQRLVRVLATGQFFNGLGVAIGVAMAPLAATALSGSDTIGGAAPTCLVIGTAVSAMPLARIASRYGRRPALTVGFACGVLGGAIAVVAVLMHAWLPLLAGMLVFGVSSAASYATRYAATDLAEPSRRGSALAVVIWPTTGGVVLGPNLLAPAERLSAAAGMAPLAGPFALAGLAFAVTTMLVFIGLRPDPLLLARSMAGVDLPREAGPRRERGRHSLPVANIRMSPQIRWCIYALAAGHAVMISIMVMAPINMQQHMFPLSTIGMVVSGHLVGMYALSPVFGWLTDRFGAPSLLLAGLAAMAVAALLSFAAAAGQPWLTGIGLFVLGVGWSSDVVAGSALLTEQTPVIDRPLVQGLSDLAMDVCGALASLAAGLVVAAASFRALTIAVAALVAVFLPFQIRRLGLGRQPAP